MIKARVQSDVHLNADTTVQAYIIFVLCFNFLFSNSN